MSFSLAPAGERLRHLRAQIAATLGRGAARDEDGTLILSKEAQSFIVGAVGIAAIILIILALLVRHLLVPPAEAARGPVNPDGSVRLTPTQMEFLAVEPAQAVPFQSTETTEGVIALDDDLSTPVFSPYSGRVTRLYAAAGDQVKKGAPLLGVEAAEIVQGENDLFAAAAALTTARAQLKLAETAAERQRSLYEAKAAALKDLQAAEVELVDARGKFNTAEAALAAARHRLRILGETDAAIAALEKDPQSAHVNPEGVVYAPIAGTVMQRQVGPGQFIQANGGTPVFTVGDLSKVWLVANVRESDAGVIHRGDTVEVTVPAFPDRVFRAQITYIAAAIDPATHRLPVRAEVENADGALKPQMFASFRIVSGDARMVVAVPENAVVFDGEKAHVWVMNAAGNLARREIETGRRDGHRLEVVRGLQDGERVVVRGPLFVDQAANGSG